MSLSASGLLSPITCVARGEAEREAARRTGWSRRLRALGGPGVAEIGSLAGGGRTSDGHSHRKTPGQSSLMHARGAEREPSTAILLLCPRFGRRTLRKATFL